MQDARPWTSGEVNCVLICGSQTLPRVTSVFDSGCYTGLMDEDVYIVILFLKKDIRVLKGT